MSVPTPSEGEDYLAFCRRLMAWEDAQPLRGPAWAPRGYFDCGHGGVSEVSYGGGILLLCATCAELARRLAAVGQLPGYLPEGWMDHPGRFFNTVILLRKRPELEEEWLP